MKLCAMFTKEGGLAEVALLWKILHFKEMQKTNGF